MSGRFAKLTCGVFSMLMVGCGERVAVEEDPIIKKLGTPDEIMYALGDGEDQPTFFLNKGPPSRWALYRYEVDGWLIQVMTKDKHVVSVTSDNIKESEERARKNGDELRKRLSP